MKNFLLTLSGLFYALVGAIHLVRLYTRWTVTIESFAVPLKVSAWAGPVFLVLAFLCLAARKRS